MPPEILVALGALVVVVLGALGASIAGWFTRQTNKANAQVIIDAKAAEIKAELEAKTRQIASDIESQNLKERETIRGMLDFYIKRVAELNTEIVEVRKSCISDVAGLREEVRVARLEIAGLKHETGGQKGEIAELKKQTEAQKAEIEAGREREAKLREDVDHMPQEIARLKKLIEGEMNGAKTKLSAESQGRVKDAEEDAGKDEKPP